MTTEPGFLVRLRERWADVDAGTVGTVIGWYADAERTALVHFAGRDAARHVPDRFLERVEDARRVREDARAAQEEARALRAQADLQVRRAARLVAPAGQTPPAPLGIGEVVVYRGRRLVVRGVDPMGVHEPHAYLRDEESGERLAVRVDRLLRLAGPDEA